MQLHTGPDFIAKPRFAGTPWWTLFELVSGRPTTPSAGRLCWTQEASVLWDSPGKSCSGIGVQDGTIQ